MSSQKTTFSRKLLFYAIMVLLIVVVTELTAYVFLLVSGSSGASYASVQEERLLQIAADEEVVTREDRLVSHPYVGYVFNPDVVNKERRFRKLGIRVSEYGFSGSAEALFDGSADSYAVAITGGSVAFQFANMYGGMDALVEALKKRYPEQTISVHALANGGYKQPQQYLSLSYLLALGARFDMVINLDGFNEVALPPVESIHKRVNPFYPRTWYSKLSGLHDTFMLSTAGKVAILRERQVAWARLFSGLPLRYSATANFLWRVYDQWLDRKILELETTFQKHTVSSTRYEVAGPAYELGSEDQLYADLARVWKDSSLQMHRLCKENGIPYFHFLQPNQYVPGSKPMGQEERALAYQEGSSYRPGVVKGYPYLHKAGQELKNLGVDFVDLTMVFENIEEPLYSDDCCHVGPEGNAILGQAIGDHILEKFADETNAELAM